MKKINLILIIFSFLIYKNCFSQEIPQKFSDSILSKASFLFDYEKIFFIYQINGMYGICSKQKIITYPIYNYIMPDNNRFLVSIITNGTSKYGWLDSVGNKMFDPVFDKVNFFYSKKKTTVKINSTYKIISIENEVINTDYDYLSSIENNLIVVRLNNKYGIIDENNKIIIKPEYDNLYNFTEGLACAKKNGKWGFINLKNKTVIPFIYDKGSIFSEGLACMKKNGKWGYINNKNKVIINFKYTGSFFERFDSNDDMFGAIVLSQFYNGKAKLELDGKLIYIKKTGEERTYPF
jgi:hypothetical protein